MTPRKSRANTGSQESGYKFDCQYCEGVDVVQGPPPELLFLLERQGRNTTSTAYQCCVECAAEVKELNAKYNKKYNPPVKQVVPLREGSELPPEIQAAKAEVDRAKATEQKLDKVVDAIAGLANMMAQFMQIQLQKEPLGTVAPLATMRVTNAASQTAKPKDAKPKTAAKPKPSSRKC